MKRKLVITFLGIIIILLGIVSYNKFWQKDEEKKSQTKIKLAEVTHSAFYAPLYVALENGYFEKQGIDLELILTPGADKVAAAVLSNDVKIGFAGAESAIYVYNGGEKDYLEIFSGLTKRDGQFIISRTEKKDFSLADLKGKEVLVGRKGGMPALNFLNALKNAGIDESELKLNYSIDFASLGGSFIGGTGDYVNLFEPTATALVNQKYGYIVASIGKLSGEMPYTAFYARKSYIEENKDLINNFTKAINEGLNYVQENDAEKIAEVILPQFPNLALNDLVNIVENYKTADSWLKNPFVSQQSFENLENVMIDNELLNDYVPFEKLVNNFYNE